MEPVEPISPIITSGLVNHAVTQDTDALDFDFANVAGFHPDLRLAGHPGQVTIACSPIPMMLVVPSAIGQFGKTFPAVEVRIMETVYPEVMNEFRQGRIDFAIGPIPERGLGRDYKTIRLMETELVVAVRRGHPKARCKTLRDLRDDRWMVMGPPGGPGAIIDQAFTRLGLQPPATPLYLETVWSALEMLEHTDLIGFIPRPLALSAAGEIALVPVAEAIPAIKLDAIVPAKAILTPAARALMSEIRASVASRPPR